MVKKFLTIFMFLCLFMGLTLSISTFYVVADDDTFRHEGLLIDSWDIEFIQPHLQEEPWKTAWKDLKKRCESEDRLNRVVAQAVRYALKPEPSHADKVIENLNTICQKSENPHENLAQEMRMLYSYALALEMVRPAELSDEFLQQSKEFLESRMKNLLEKDSQTPWIDAIHMAISIVLDQQETFENLKESFIERLKENYNEDGSPKNETPIPRRIINLSAMISMAEMVNHHGEIFWGSDLYHISFGPKNMHALCKDLFDSLQKSSEQDNIRHWGWLELTTKTFGEPEWLEALQSKRPVFDIMAGGPVTLTHARWLKSGLPEFGKAPDGFHWLYNKEDLTGWQYSSRWIHDIKKDDFYLEDGVFYTRGASDHWLMTDRMYADFILRLEYKIGEGSNSGIMFWAPIPGRPSKTGFEVQILDDHDKPPRKSGSGALYDIVAPKVNAQKPAGEWNKIEIMCKDPHVKVTLNDKVVQDINLDEYPETQGRRRRGYIGLQDHAHKVAFRNVRIKVLER